MCVQARDGFFGLRKGICNNSDEILWKKNTLKVVFSFNCYVVGNDAVLGPVHSNSLQVTEAGVPFEHAITRQKLRPGSGFLSVNVTTDGPTRVIEITDIQNRVWNLN